MCKRFFAVTLVLALLAALLPAPVRAAEPMSGVFVNSDMEASRDGVCWYVDTMGDGCLMAMRPASECENRDGIYDGEYVIWPVTDFPVDQVLCGEDGLLVSAGARLLRLDPESGKLLEERRFDAPVERFAVSAAGLWVLSGGQVLLLDGKTTKPVVTGASRFWLEAADRLCYMRDEQTVFTLELSTGRRSEAPNQASDLEQLEAEGLCSVGLSAMRQKFPHGRYWNHMPTRGCGMYCNNQDGWTNLACYRHNNYCGTSLQTCNGYAPDGEEISYQCWGFADKLGHDVSGRDPQSHDQGYGWRKLWVSSALNSLKAGDIIRYNKSGTSIYHSIYVTGVSGDTITYADCNYDGTCVIRWGQTISKSTVRQGFVFLLIAPEAANWEPSYQLDVNGRLDGADAANTASWAIFDVWINGQLSKTDVSEFREYQLKGSSYEIRNVRTFPGIMFDPAAGSGLSGTLNANSSLVLALDHYYLNSAGEKIKTRFCDLPDPSKWSYRPVCWALEHGVASGLTETRFGPGEGCNRAQAMTFLWILSGRPEPAGSASPFADVRADAYYFKPVLWAVEQGITVGRTPESFRPKGSCSRGEVLTFLWSLAGKPVPAVLAAAEPGESSAEPAPNLSPFADVTPEHYYYAPVLWAVEQGITAGTAPNSFSPKKACTRAEILAFLCTYWQEQ